MRIPDDNQDKESSAIPDDTDVTLLIQHARNGDSTAADRLFRHLQETVRHVAQAIMRGESNSVSLEPSGLLNAAMARVYEQNVVDWAPNRRYLYGSAINAMRRVLIDHARRRNAKKRRPEETMVPLDSVIANVEDKCQADYEDLHEALDRLGKRSPELLKVVELRFLNGCSLTETAELLDSTARTVSRQWRLARAILFKDLHCD